MNAKNILAGGFIGGIVLFVVNFVVSAIILAVAPYDIFSLGGIRPADDPLLVFFFVAPFILSFAAAIVFDLVKGSLHGTPSSKGAIFGAALFLIYTVPSLFVTFTSMDYPTGFYFENLLFGILGFPLIGVIYAMLWERLP
jgi:hypothetical protein